MIYFTADEHLAHKNIIKYCKRPFENVKEMNETIINKHNFLVEDKDTVYHIGDFTLLDRGEERKIQKLFNQLNGQHHLILGNHDKLKPFTYQNFIGFKSVHTWLKVEEFILTHCPKDVNTHSDETIFLTGHTHNNYSDLKRDGNIINVGVDVWNFYPASIKQVRSLFKKEI